MIDTVNEERPPGTVIGQIVVVAEAEVTRADPPAESDEEDET